ncbi:MAG: M48 family metalloprotease [Candidatus Nanopelagicales bacterium]
MTPARSASAVALAAFAAAGLIAVIAVPWDAGVAPWSDLATDALSSFSAEQIARIDAYVAAAWPPGVLSLVAGPIAAIGIALIPAVRRRITAIGSASVPARQGRLGRPAGPARQGRLGRPAGPGSPVRRAVSDAIMAGIVLAIVRLAVLPFAIWSAQVRREAGLLVESWAAWWLRWLGESIAYVAVGALAITVGLAVLRRWPRRGWIAVTAGAGVAAMLITAVLPLVQRLEGTTADPALTARVMQIADRAGVDVGRVSVIAVADTSPALNANVSGWGPTRSVTIYDTVATTMSDAEIDALIAHELIHVREGDAVLGALLAILAATGTAALVCALALSPRVRRWLGATSPSDARVIPLVVAVFLVAALAATVAGATISRPLESRADREALALTGDADAYRSLITTLAVTNRSTLTPAQWRYALLFTHPTPLQRLAAARS